MQCVKGIKPFDMIACIRKYRYTLKQIIIMVCFGIKVVLLWPQKLLFLGELHKDSQHDVTTTTLILMSPIQPFPIIMLPLNSFGKIKNAKNEVHLGIMTLHHFQWLDFLRNVFFALYSTQSRWFDYCTINWWRLPQSSLSLLFINWG